MSATTWALPSQVLLVGRRHRRREPRCRRPRRDGKRHPHAADDGLAHPAHRATHAAPLGAGCCSSHRFRPSHPGSSCSAACRQLPEHERFAFAAGLGGTIWVMNVATTTVGMIAAGGLSVGAQGALALLLPSYFLFGLVAAWRGPSDAAATVTGFILGPLLSPIFPGTSLLVGGPAGRDLRIRPPSGGCRSAGRREDKVLNASLGRFSVVVALCRHPRRRRAGDAGLALARRAPGGASSRRRARSSPGPAWSPRRSSRRSPAQLILQPQGALADRAGLATARRACRGLRRALAFSERVAPR